MPDISSCCTKGSGCLCYTEHAAIVASPADARRYRLVGRLLRRVSPRHGGGRSAARPHQAGTPSISGAGRGDAENGAEFEAEAERDGPGFGGVRPCFKFGIAICRGWRPKGACDCCKEFVMSPSGDMSPVGSRR